MAKGVRLHETDERNDCRISNFRKPHGAELNILVVAQSDESNIPMAIAGSRIQRNEDAEASLDQTEQVVASYTMHGNSWPFATVGELAY